MTDDEKKIDAKLKFAIDTARSSINAASDAAHEKKFADEDEADFEYDMELAWVVKRLPGLCPHNLRVLNHIIDVLFDIQEHEHEHVLQQSSH
jgi:hypothetical protein